MASKKRRNPGAGSAEAPSDNCQAKQNTKSARTSKGPSNTRGNDAQLESSEAGKFVLFRDFETRSTLDLSEVGAWKYANHPTTDVWCCRLRRR